MHILSVLAAVRRKFLPSAQSLDSFSSSQEDQQAPEALANALAEAVGPLLAVMRHPKLGGPGFLAIRFGREITAAAQFPNIADELYQRIARKELERDSLLEAGIPVELLDLGVSFEIESGGMVLLSLKVRGIDGILPEGYRERAQALAALTAELGRLYPDLEVRTLGGEILLSPAEGSFLSGCQR